MSRAEHTPGPPVSELFRGTAARFRDKPALRYEHEAISFGQLDRWTADLAEMLNRLIPSGQRLGIYAGNSAEWVAAYIAGHRAGISVVPINPNYRRRELTHILGEADLGLLLYDCSSEDLRSRGVDADFPTLSVHSVAFQRGRHAGRPSQLPPRRWPTEDVIAYTSGTSAFPKGVRVTQGNQIFGNLLTTQLILGTSYLDSYLLVTPLAHRAAQTFLLTAMLSGATACLMSKYEPDDFPRTVAELEVSVVVGVPTMLRSLLAMFDRGEIRPMNSVKRVFLTGEAMPSQHRRDVMTLFPHARFVSAYASTEAGVMTCLDHEDQLRKSDSCGKLVPGVDLRIVDETGAEVAHGQIGEIHAKSGRPGTYTVGAGYLGQPEDSFTDVDGWFPTGDLGRFDQEMYLHIVGRLKDMILTGGVNVAASEVEKIIATHPDVLEVAVTGASDNQYGERIVAWIVLKPKRSLTAADVKQHVRMNAASYKKPREVHFLRSLPRTATGKIKKGELRAGADHLMANRLSNQPSV